MAENKLKYLLEREVWRIIIYRWQKKRFLGGRCAANLLIFGLPQEKQVCILYEIRFNKEAASKCPENICLSVSCVHVTCYTTADRP